MGAYWTSKVGCFSNFSKYSVFCFFITQLLKKLQQWSLSEVIKDILPFVWNTKWPLSNIWLLRYKQNSFGCFWQKRKFWPFFENTQNCFAHNSVTNYCSEAVLYSKRTAGYSHCYSFFISWVMKQKKMLNLIHLQKHPRFRLNAETWIFWGSHCVNKNRLLEFWENSISMKIDSHQTVPKKGKS